MVRWSASKKVTSVNKTSAFWTSGSSNTGPAVVAADQVRVDLVAFGVAELPVDESRQPPPEVAHAVSLRSDGLRGRAASAISTTRKPALNHVT